MAEETTQRLDSLQQCSSLVSSIRSQRSSQLLSSLSDKDTGKKSFELIINFFKF